MLGLYLIVTLLRGKCHVLNQLKIRQMSTQCQEKSRTARPCERQMSQNVVPMSQNVVPNSEFSHEMNLYLFGFQLSVVRSPSVCTRPFALVSQTPPRRTTDCDCTMQDLPPPLHHPVEPKKVLPPVHIRVRWPKRAGATSLCKVYVKIM